MMKQQWKRHSAELKAKVALQASKGQRDKTDGALLAALSQEIGQLKVELDWLKTTGTPLVRRNGR